MKNQDHSASLGGMALTDHYATVLQIKLSVDTEDEWEAWTATLIGIIELDEWGEAECAYPNGTGW